MSTLTTYFNSNWFSGDVPGDPVPVIVSGVSGVVSGVTKISGGYKVVVAATVPIDWPLEQQAIREKGSFVFGTDSVLVVGQPVSFDLRALGSYVVVDNVSA